MHIVDKERVTQNGPKDGEKDTEQSKNSESCTTSSACGLTGAGHSNRVLPILPVKVKSSKGNKVIKTYAFLDPGSTGTFCSEKLINRLNTEGRKAKIHLMGHAKTVESSIVDGLEILEFSGEHYPLPVPRKRYLSLQAR